MAKFERELHAKASDVIKALAGRVVSELPELELIDSSTYSAGQVSIYLFVYRGQSSQFEMTLLGDRQCRFKLHGRGYYVGRRI